MNAYGTAGSPVITTRYTTDGTDPVTSPTAKTYVLPFDLKQTTTVKFYSVDQAAHAEPVRSWLVRIDAAPPAVSITSPASGSRYPPGAKITIAAAAADKGTGSGRPSGVTGVRFYLDGRTQLAALTTRPYSFTWKPTKGSKGKHQLTAVATDRAGIPPPPPSPCT